LRSDQAWKFEQVLNQLKQVPAFNDLNQNYERKILYESCLLSLDIVDGSVTENDFAAADFPNWRNMGKCLREQEGDHTALIAKLKQFKSDLKVFADQFLIGYYEATNSLQDVYSLAPIINKTLKHEREAP